MVKSRPGKKAKSKPAQPDLPAKPPPEPPGTTRLLPMQLQIGDRMTDSTGEWQVVGRPFTTVGGKTAHVRLKRVNQPGVTDIRTWGAHERINVKRASAEEGTR